MTKKKIVKKKATKKATKKAVKKSTGGLALSTSGLHSVTSLAGGSAQEYMTIDGNFRARRVDAGGEMIRVHVKGEIIRTRLPEYVAFDIPLRAMLDVLKAI